MAGADEPVDFARDVKPILQAHCVKCHGPAKQEGGLRLDRRADALRGGDSYAPAILPGNSAKSPLWMFIADATADLKMPPEGPRLGERETALLKRWIDSGANWPADDSAAPDQNSQHWAFQPLARPALPSVSNLPAGANPVDAFLAVTLAEQGLAFSPPAERQALMRRLYFDLIGLPPTPKEVSAFVADINPAAYEQLVDRLLDSPRYGERWARHWLDVVRFAESHGFEMNQVRPNAWRYRDYVIAALNSDKPYDQFIREQLAGDQLGAEAATGFLVAGAWDQVKSPDPTLTAQQRADELHDMVSVAGSAFLGLTVGCARCHTHKFDPIPQTDYYALKACLEGVQHGERPLSAPASPSQAAELAAAESKLREIAGELAAWEPSASRQQTVLLEVDSPPLEKLAPAKGPALDKGNHRGAAAFAGSAEHPPTLSKGYLHWNAEPGEAVAAWRPKQAGRWRVWLSWGCGWPTHAKDARYLLDQDGDLSTKEDRREIARIDQQRFADGSDDLPKLALWSGFRDAGLHELTASSAIVLQAGEQAGVVTADLIVLQAEAANVESDPADKAPQLTLRPPPSSDLCTDRFPPTRARLVRFTILKTSSAEPCLDELEIFTKADNGEERNAALASLGAMATASGTLPGHAIHKLEHIHDGRFGNERSWISATRGGGWVQIEFPREETIHRVQWSRDRSPQPRYADRVATHYRIEVSRDGAAWQTVANQEDRLPHGFALPANALFAAFIKQPSSGSRLAELFAVRTAAEATIARLKQPATMAYAGKFSDPPATRRFHRGDPTQPREEIAPGVLSRIGSPLTIAPSATDAERRTALAAWIASKENPLTARVLVNRLWQHHFGEGLVDTPSDFGVNGSRPTHPELLDWLASELLTPTLTESAKPWSLKHLHRVLCRSAAYRQSSAPRPDGLAKDAASRLLWRYPPRRLEAEPLRDAVLSVSGALNLQAGGPGFDLFEPNGNYVKVYKPKSQFGPDDFRRLIYWSKPRMRLEDTFGPFDCPDGGQVAPKRSASITPLQALSLLNSPFLVQQSDLFAARLAKEADTDEARIARAFQLALQRNPDATESAAGLALVRAHGWPALCRALFNTSEFLETP